MSDNNKRLTQMTSSGGWGAKIGPGVLSQILSRLPKNYDENLIVGYDTSDDAAVYKINDDLVIIQTVDFFPPIVDDPYTFGQIAAANAISDIYAMGAIPKIAMNIISIPSCLPIETIEAILQGGYQKALEAGITIAGGHSIQDPEPKFGLCVTGFAKPSEVLTNSGAKVGDYIVITKPIGTGILSTAASMNMLSVDGYNLMVKYMTMLNREGRDAIVPHKPTACTDVTGFGLLGHLLEMAEGSNVTIELNSKEVPLIAGAYEFALEDIFPGGAYKNLAYVKNKFTAENIPQVMLDILCDPQTSGGLMASMSETDAIELCKEYKDAKIIARVLEKGEKSIIII